MTTTHDTPLTGHTHSSDPSPLFQGSICRPPNSEAPIIRDVVRSPEQERDYLRFFWWENSFDEEPKEWRTAVHLFGACSSLSIANFVLKQTASDFGNKFSDGARYTVTNNFYVDDCLRAKDREDALLVILLEVKELCKKG
ncbi:uncharacterized protein [Palaemon carinicauda]|uniref:uncharacterized protein n=1 Tax=Palaemon carinicauda TaxID=392227 RepID=UPI0035B5E672